MVFLRVRSFSEQLVNTLRARLNDRHFTDDLFKCIFLNENIWISNKISLKFVPKYLICNIPALVQIMAWRRPGDKPLSEPMMVRLPTHICVTRPQWVNFICMLSLNMKSWSITLTGISLREDIHFVKASARKNDTRYADFSISVEDTYQS